MEGVDNGVGDASMDISDSRKRPIDSDLEQSISKRANKGETQDVLLKQLIPSSLAGVILGKGGETITGLQTTTGTVMKMSKGNDFYPGTSDRILLITGHAENVRHAHQVTWDKLHNRPDVSKGGVIEELKMKIVVPNVTVGMIIGRGGCYIKQIKDDTGAYVQISQKAPDTLLVERVVTIGGSNEQMMHAFDMVLKMIIEDSQSGSCPNISYSDFKGPIANANPVGSPFAGAGAGIGVQNMHGFDMGNPFGFMSGLSGAGYNVPPFGGGSHPTPSSIETLKTALRGSGYTIQASEEIAAAICTLINYGIVNPCSFGYPGFNTGGGQCGVTLEGLMGVLATGRLAIGGPGDMASKGGDKMGGGFGNSMEQFMAGFGMYGGAGVGGQNNFGAGNNTGHAAITAGSDDGPTTSKEVQIAESIVGAVLGHGGRAIVEIQRLTGTSVQISKKGVFAPGTKNRIATITGNQTAVERAIFMVNQCIQQEESKRVRQDHTMK